MILVQKVINTPGSSVVLEQKGSNKAFVGTLRWTSSVDLDLHCFYRLKGSGPVKKKGFLSSLFGGGSSGPEGQVSFRNKGSLTREPWIQLDQDSGVGDVGGDNEENIRFVDLSKLDGFIIVANIYGKDGSNFAKYNGKVLVTGGGQEVSVPLTESSRGSWCVVASVDCQGAEPIMKNINKTSSSKPSLSTYL